jgi:hypothetical protein
MGPQALSASDVSWTYADARVNHSVVLRPATKTVIAEECGMHCLFGDAHVGVRMVDRLSYAGMTIE